jgi:hypothetical protein
VRAESAQPSLPFSRCEPIRKHYPNALGEAVPSMGTLLTEEQNEEVEEVQVMESVEIDI